ncbi:MAG: hypothetical protein KAI83_20020 [Thiomargarita sp.]|nr:hypothetical protein [Thiomargarita sp.]
MSLIAGEAEDDDEKLIMVNERIDAITKENASYAINETDVQKKLLERPTDQSSESLSLADFQIDRKALPSYQPEGETRNEQV